MKYSKKTCAMTLTSDTFVKLRLVATCHLQTCYNLLKRLDNKLATSFLAACNRLVLYKLSLAMPCLYLINFCEMLTISFQHVFSCVNSRTRVYRKSYFSIFVCNTFPGSFFVFLYDEEIAGTLRQKRQKNRSDETWNSRENQKNWPQIITSCKKQIIFVLSKMEKPPSDE